ncbi:MAG: hypothetical protein HY078_08395 [Elusimicrobia bacterium]|nr:hypothetical protein [Elusimicrobiota bacterium]
MKGKQGLKISLRNDQRLALLGRLRMADWIEMPEKEFARELESIEKDALFKTLYFGGEGRRGAISRQRWPGGRMNGSFYEINEQIVAGKGERVKVEEALGEKVGLVEKIQKMGRAAFEKYFLYGEESHSLPEIAKETSLSEEDVQAIHEFLLEIGAQAEFYLPTREPDMVRSYSCLARLSISEDGEPRFEFFSPHWARGYYQIRYDSIEEWKRSGQLTADQRRRLPHFLKRLETINLRQNTIYRILESATKLQAEYLKSKNLELMLPISLRKLAQRLDLAPSTVSRALAGRSIRLPWGKEAPLITLVPGRRKVVREIVGDWLDAGAQGTDAVFAERLKSEFGIRVSRRTVNAVRNEMKKRGA